MVSAEALATVNVRVITELYMYIDKRPAFNYLELNQLLRCGNGPFDLLKRFYFGIILFSIVHNDTMESWNVLSCSIIAYHQSLSETQKLDSQFMLHKFYMKTSPRLKCFLVSR